MIQLKISGRAGNQFFQYAEVINYMKKNNINEDIYISFEHLNKHKTDNNTFVNVLNDFKVKEFKIINKIKMTPKQKIIDFIYKVLYKIVIIKAKMKRTKLQRKDYIFIKNVMQKLLNKNGLYYYIPEMEDFYPSKSKNIIFYGSFENNSFFEENKNAILNMYEPKLDELSQNKEMYKIIRNTESVCVTIRRGDFLNPQFIDNYYICNNYYFEQAIKKMNDLIEKPQYIVFSDDVEWCKKNMKFPEETIFETEGNPIWEKIRLMYSCKHFIISNSTFSWWAQYLSRNTNKIVIAPKVWNKFEYMDLIYDKKWILI